ncbi:MAG: translocation/assembly module TamB domain-containing protein, partial [Rhodobacteraceae bacterium]|nr:translocation/assembly module TamB domain-containing protein [Paracoccaceae bacterium]
AKAEQSDAETMRVTAESRLAIGTLVDASAELARQPGGFAATLETLRLRQAGQTAQLAAPATVTVAEGAVTLTPLELDFGTGKLSAEGRVAEDIDLRLDIADMPLDIANAIRPQLALAGVVNGTARVGGTRAAPNITFDAGATGLAAAPTRAAGIPPIDVTARGRTEGERLDVDAGVSAAGGLSARASGAVPLGAGDLDLTVDLAAFPLSLVDQIAGNRGLAGNVTGNARVTGPLADPSASFDIEGTGIGAAVLRQNAVPPMNVTLSGGFSAGTLTLATARLGGAPGLDISGSGRIPLTGSGLDMRASGTVPLALANPLLEARSAQASGTVQLDVSAQGSLAAPRLAGNVSLNGGTFVLPQLNVRLEDISLDAGLEGDAVVLRGARAAVSGGGEITAEGRVSIDGARGFPADLSMRMNDVRYTDGAFVTTRFSGQLAVNGPLQGGGGTLSGRIDLGRTEISISEALGVNAQAKLEQVEHLRPPLPVVETLDRAQIGAPQPPQATGRSGLELDIRVSAPNQIFVRGRGLDAELGGELRLRGPTTDIEPVGQFDMRRGRIVVLAQRIEFDEGSLTLEGDFDPRINFVAHSTSGDVTAIVTVSGRASEPDIVFSSEPPLPEDEVLSRLLFKRASQDLSPFQAAQLAAAAAELAGAGGSGLLASLRSSTGLDDLDIITEDSGATAVRAGKYISENVYLDVQTASDGVSRAEVVVEINDMVTARGSVGTDGNTRLGIFYERDY